MLWTACLLTSSTTLPSEALAGQGYLQRETGTSLPEEGGGRQRAAASPAARARAPRSSRLAHSPQPTKPNKKQQNTGNLKNLIQVPSSSSPAGGACPASLSSSSSSDPSGGGGGSFSPPYSSSAAAHPRGSGGRPSSSSPSPALGGCGWPLHARELLAGERHYHLERLYLRRVLASWAALGFLPSASRLLKAGGSGSGGDPLRPSPDATGLPAPFAGIKAID